jgi:hypothetical protein
MVMSPDLNPNRQQRSVPVAGQFANKVNQESRIELVEEASPFDPSRFMNEGVEEPRRHSYVSATTASSIVDPRSSARCKGWWDRHNAAGEFGNPEGGYPQSPVTVRQHTRAARRR